MKLSQNMKAHLAYVVATQTGPGWPKRIRLGPCYHHANQVTHDALVRRGLIVYSRRYGTMATKAGLAMAAKLRAEVSP